MRGGGHPKMVPTFDSRTFLGRPAGGRISTPVTDPKWFPNAICEPFWDARSDECSRPRVVSRWRAGRVGGMGHVRRIEYAAPTLRAREESFAPLLADDSKACGL